MIEINLLPGTTRRAARTGFRFGGGGARKQRAATGTGPALNRNTTLVAVLWLAVLGGVAYLHLSGTNRLDELQAEYEAAQRDSARFALLRSQGDSLAQREAVIAQKVQLIQEIDAGRYVWSHILDEVSRALPTYIWMVQLLDLGNTESPVPQMRIEGRAGNYYAIGEFIEDLEASPFLKNVRLVSSQRVIQDERAVLQFILELSYQEPPPDAIQTVPLFAATPQEN